MSYTRNVGDMTIHVVCKADPETDYGIYHQEIEDRIKASGYTSLTTMDNLVSMIILSFDCDDNYGDYDPETGFGGYGEAFSVERCMQYVEDSGGYREFDYYA